mgnify:CR=1 FL=1
MAFSYSDENFTVVGNLCFVHIKTTTTGAKTINIPPALAARMLIDDYSVSAANITADGTSVAAVYAKVKDKKITFTPTKALTYLNFSFPINANK